MIINIYNIINNNVVSDKIKICFSLNEILEEIKRGKEEIFCYLSDMINNENRLDFLLGIKNLEIDESMKKDLVLVNYMILNNGIIKRIKDFDIVKKNIEKISSVGLDELKDKNLEEERGKCEREIEDKNNANSVKMSYIVRLTSLFNLMKKEIDNKEEDILNDLSMNIIEEREKELNENSKIIRTELDIINNTIKNNLERDEIEKLEIIKCVYNDIEISHEELLKELLSHVFPEYITEKNIEDTLEDTYEIETNYLKIKRIEGGEILIKKIK